MASAEPIERTDLVTNSGAIVKASFAVPAVAEVTGANAAPRAADNDTILGNAETSAQSYGPIDDAVVETEQFEITPGGDPVGRVFATTTMPGMIAPMATWGASYAISSETAQLYYTGRAKAAANVYNGLRIVKVCFWYSRGGSAVSSTYCSTASSSGSYWSPGAEVRHGVWDSLDPNAPPTVFNIQTTRINPNVY